VLTPRVGCCSPVFWKTILGEERMHEHFVRRPPGCSPHQVGGGRVEVVPVIVDPVLQREVHCWVLRVDVDCSEKL
jgi:hypothetical protein